MYLTHLTMLIQLRTEWISANEPRMEQTDTTDASDIADLESKLDEHEVSKPVRPYNKTRNWYITLNAV